MILLVQLNVLHTLFFLTKIEFLVLLLFFQLISIYRTSLMHYICFASCQCSFSLLFAVAKCTDLSKYCSLANKFNMCQMPRYNSQCCKSCRGRASWTHPHSTVNMHTPTAQCMQITFHQHWLHLPNCQGLFCLS